MSWKDWLFPPKCPFCGKILKGPAVCPDCEKSLPWASPLLREGTGFGRCAAPLYYQDTVRKAVLRLKFAGKDGGAEALGGLVAAAAAECFPGEFDCVTWVPVSNKRLRQRGYDQARLLARAACALWDTEPVRLLVKETDNPAQSGLKDAAARRANVLGVYRALPEASGQRILLIDDVITTGATLAECVRELRRAGAADVVCAALAQTGGEKRKNPQNSST